MSIKSLQDYTYVSKYASYNSKEKRRETWNEAIDRVLAMHLRKYPEIQDELIWAFEQSRQKRVLGSQRALQYGGEPIERKNARIFNCISSYCDRIEFFQECFWLLLCGCGTGYSVQKHHVDKLPNFSPPAKKDKKVYVIPDTIEGWSDSLGILLATYFYHPKYYNWEGFDVEFDFSLIRSKGSPLSSGVGKAPGPDPLIKALKRIKNILDDRSSKCKKLRPIDAHDIIMHASDAVLSGGVRRSACLSLFSPDDIEMATCKTGNWFNENPQRARANNSALLIRNEVSKREFDELIKSVKEFGEPGFIFSDSKESLYNPCVEVNLYAYDDNGNSGWQACNLCEINGKKCKDEDSFRRAAKAASIIGTAQAGYTDFEYLGEVSRSIIEKEALLGVSITGIQDNPNVLLNADIQRSTAALVVETNKEIAKKIGINQAARCTCIKPAGCRPIDSLTTTEKGILTLDEIMENHDIRNEWGTTSEEVNTHGGRVTKTFINGIKETVKVNLKYGITLECTPNHPWFVKYKIDRKKKAKRIEINDWIPAQQLEMGHVVDIDLKSYRNDIHSSLKKEYRLKAFDKHLYHSKEITQPDKLNNEISWLLGYLWGDGTMKVDKFGLSFIDQNLYNLNKVKNIVKNVFNICTNIRPCKNKDAYELDFSNKFLWHWLVLNEIYKYKEDGKIAKIPRVIRESSHKDIIAFIAGMIDSDGCVRFQTIKNGVKRYTAIFSTANDEFANHFQHVAMSVGLLFSKSLNKCGENKQKTKNMWLLNLSSHVDGESFSLLSDNSEKIKILPTGYNWKHDVFSPNVGILGKVHSVEDGGFQPTFDVETESHWFRAGAIKSHNTTSCILGTASGIHPHHAKRYFRRQQANALEAPFQHFKKFNPRAVDKSVWSANDTDEIVTFMIDVPKGGIVKNDLPALALLENVKSTQMNWVASGAVKKICSQDWLMHNVSNTINVKNNEWEQVSKFIFKNRKYFAGVSLLPMSGDLDYPQAPMVTVRDHREIASLYGPGSSFASGLIVDGLRAFNNDLWKACSSALNPELIIDPTPKEFVNKEIIQMEERKKLNDLLEQYKLQKDWVRRAEQFANRYFDNDVKKMTYCLKDVHNWKLWNDLEREYVDVDFSTLVEYENNVKINETVACAGGACQII